MGYSALFSGEAYGLIGAMPSNPFHSFLPDWRETLRHLMTAARYNARSLSLAANLGASTVSEWLNPKKRKTPSFESLAAVAAVLNVPLDRFVTGSEAGEVDGNHVSKINLSYANLEGELRAGHWIEANVHTVEDNTLVPIIPHSDFAGLKQYAWRVGGSSMNKVVKPGEFVVGVSFYDIGDWRKLQHGDLVVCERRDGLKFEYTLKRVAIVERRYRLDAESEDPRWQEPVWLSETQDGEETLVQATHLIIGRFGFLV